MDKEITKDLKICYVETMGQVLEHALSSGKK